MKKSILVVLCSIVIISCKKEDAVTPGFSEAIYKVEFTGRWMSPEFGVPPGVHFTPILGMVHDKDGLMWKEGLLATPGVENLAETGNLYPLLTEIDSYIAAGHAVSIVVIPQPAPAGSSQVNIYCNSNYSFLSLETMLAPTPDWFTGISNFDLYAGGKWIDDTTINLYAWDAGTEDGDVFGYANPPTIPQQTVRLLEPANASVLANGNAVLGPIGILRITRQ